MRRSANCLRRMAWRSYRTRGWCHAPRCPSKSSFSISLFPHSVVGRRNVPAPRHPQHRTPMHGGGRKTTDVVEGSGVIHISACRADTARHLLLESPDNARELFVGECNPGGPWPQAIPTCRARRAVAKRLGVVIRNNAADSHLRPRIATPSIFRVKIALCGFPSAIPRDVSLHIARYGRHSNHRTAILQ